MQFTAAEITALLARAGNGLADLRIGYGLEKGADTLRLAVKDLDKHSKSKNKLLAAIINKMKYNISTYIEIITSTKLIEEDHDFIVNHIGGFFSIYDGMKTKLSKIELLVDLLKDRDSDIEEVYTVPEFLQNLQKMSFAINDSEEYLYALSTTAISSIYLKINSSGEDLLSSEKLYEIIGSFLKKEGVVASEIDGIISVIERIIRVSVARSSRVMWEDKKKHPNLAELNAPQFLKTVHSKDIIDGIVDKSYIRAIDKDLMDAVDAYVSRRMDREGKLDLGFADGLIFQASRPGRNTKDRLKRPGL